MYVWDAVSGKLEKSIGVYAAGRNTITGSGNQCEADEDAKQLKQTLDSNFTFIHFSKK